MLNANVISAIQSAKDHLGDEYVSRLKEARIGKEKSSFNLGVPLENNSNNVRVFPNEVANMTAFINEINRDI